MVSWPLGLVPLSGPPTLYLAATLNSRIRCLPCHASWERGLLGHEDSLQAAVPSGLAPDPCRQVPVGGEGAASPRGTWILGESKQAASDTCCLDSLVGSPRPLWAAPLPCLLQLHSLCAPFPLHLSARGCVGPARIGGGLSLHPSGRFCRAAGERLE